MKRVFPLILALLFIAILVASCLTGCNRITAGEVYDKYYILIRRENDKGEWDTASYEVGKEKYESIKIGDEVSFE